MIGENFYNQTLFIKNFPTNRFISYYQFIKILLIKISDQLICQNFALSKLCRTIPHGEQWGSLTKHLYLSSALVHELITRHLVGPNCRMTTLINTSFTIDIFDHQFFELNFYIAIHPKFTKCISLTEGRNYCFPISTTAQSHNNTEVGTTSAQPQWHCQANIQLLHIRWYQEHGISSQVRFIVLMYFILTNLRSYVTRNTTKRKRRTSSIEIV